MVENEKTNGNNRGKVSVTARPKRRAESSESWSSTLCSHGSRLYVQKKTIKLNRHYLCHCNYILILSSYSDSNKGNHVVSCYPLKIYVLIIEVQWFHPGSPSQENIRPPFAGYPLQALNVWPDESHEGDRVLRPAQWASYKLLKLYDLYLDSAGVLNQP